MADNGGGADFGTKAMVAAAAFGAAFVTRKVLVFGWKKITGHEPPAEQDLSVSWVEALSWAVVVGVSIQSARMLATRLVTKRTQHPAAAEINE
jgi:hypothetical protein